MDKCEYGELVTARLTLRALRMEDAQKLYENWGSDPETTKYMSWGPFSSVDETREHIAWLIGDCERGARRAWVILLDGEPLGTIGLKDLSEIHRHAQLGYSIGSKWWGRGIMTEAAEAVLGCAFTEMGLRRVYAQHDVQNVGSGRVMQKIGMVREGVFRKHAVRRDGSIADRIWYGILRDEWEERAEIRAFCASSCRFDGFVDPPVMGDGELSLALREMRPAQPEKKYVPSYLFEMRAGGEAVGHIDIRIGYTEGLYYGGNIGYGVEPEHRGKSYAGRACRLLVPLMHVHGMEHVIITNDRDNAASRRVCEKLGAKLLRVAELPDWTELYQEGRRFVNVFDWRIS